MSIEKDVQDLTLAINTLAATIVGLTASTRLDQRIREPDALIPGKKPNVTTEKVDASAKSAPPNEESSKSSDTSNTSQSSAKESPAVSYDAVKTAILDVSKKSRGTPGESRTQAEALLARFGVEKISALSEDQYADALDYAKRVMDGLDATAAEIE